jgi:beta-glucosidase
MKYKTFPRKLSAGLLIFALLYICSCTDHQGGFDDRFSYRADSLLKLMTLEEKIGQLSLFTSDMSSTGPTIRNDYMDLIRNGRVGAIFNAFTVDFVSKIQKVAVEESRLHIPLIFGYDVVHGHRTIFPIPLGQAATWDTAMIEISESIAASEASAEGLNWTFAPMVDISRDPRWGRVMEGAGEDTYLGSLIAASRVKGFQGSSFTGNNTILACVKHFAAYGAPQAGRDYNTVDMSVRSLREWYLPPYKAAVTAGAGSVMTSFNEIAGIPSTSNKWLLTNLLREEWGFKGFIVTDYTSINELIPHGVAADISVAAEISLNAGVDMDMQGSAFMSSLNDLLKSGKVSEETIDDAVRRILVTKFRLGLFDNPYKYCDRKREKEEIMTIRNLDFARKFAAESCVLLKNDNKTLPIPEGIKSIAVIGPLADSKADMLGSWSAAGQAERCVSLLEGIRNGYGSTVNILTARGCNVNDNDMGGIEHAVAVARKADYVILALGESRDMSGEAASRSDILLPGIQMKLAEAVLKTGKPVAVVLFNGRPLAISGLDNIAPAILETWFGGTEAGNGIADVLLGKVNPSAKLTMTFPRSTGQIPVFYNCKNTGRPVDPSNPADKYKSKYLDSENTPLYPFGYGLSYTTFAYSDLKLNKLEFTGNEVISASVKIANTGDYNGQEIVQLYIRDLVGDVTRPVKELKGFRKVLIRKGESATVEFSIRPSDLSYYHQDMSYSYDPGEFELFAGTSSAEGISAKFVLH